MPRSTSIVCSQSIPNIADLRVVNLRIVTRYAQSERAVIQMPDCGQKRVRRDDSIALRQDEPCARGDKVQIGIEHINRGPLAGLLLTLDPALCDRCRFDFSLGGGD